MKFPLVVLLSALMLAGCAGAEMATSPPPPLPAQWRHDARGAAPDHEWWAGFGSAELNRLVALAQLGNLDMAAARARVGQARALARMTGAALSPQISAGFDVSRRGSLRNDRVGDATAIATDLTASYELDIWGGNAAGRTAALAELRASVFERDAATLSVTAAVAAGWLEAVALRQRIGIAERNLQSAERLLSLVESRGRAGAATPLELAQQRGLVAAQRRGLDALHQQSEDARTVLAVVLGRTDKIEIGQDSLDPLVLPSIGAGLPSELLTRRPDIAGAEALLAAAAADVVAARAAMLPSLNLTAAIGAEGERLRGMVDNPLYALAAGVTAPLFNAGRLAAGRDLALARHQELVAAYGRAILDGFADVETVLNAMTRLEAQARFQADEWAQAERALALAESRYRAGAETLLVLLDAQRTLYAAQDEAAQIKLARLHAAVGLYKALGGGWDGNSISDLEL